MFLQREYHLRFQNSKYYNLTLFLLAFGLMISCLIPFEVVLIPAVASRPNNWRKICSVAVVGSALGAAALSAVFQYFGLPMMENLFPGFTASHGWTMTASWLQSYGAWAMALIAALPVAQGPALAVAGFFKIPWYLIFVAFLLGKSIKYSIISFLVAKGESKMATEITELEKYLRWKHSKNDQGVN